MCEEEKAIEYLKYIKDWWWNNSPNRAYMINGNDIYQFDIVLKLIENLQKENEELKNGIRINTEIHKRDERIKELEEINACLHETAKECFISKDKVKEIIYPTPDNMIPLEVQVSDMYMKLKNLVEE